VVIFDRAIFTRETEKEEGWNFKKSRFGLGLLDRSPFYEFYVAYDTVVNGRPARTLYFSRETRKEVGRKG
jgi:hypothetical protein